MTVPPDPARLALQPITLREARAFVAGGQDQEGMMEGERWVAEYGDVGWEIRPALGGSLIATAYSAGAARGIVLAHNACLGLADPERAIPAARAALEAEVRAVAHQHDGDGYCHPGCEEYRQLHTEARRLRNEALALLRGGSDGKAGA